LHAKAGVFVHPLPQLQTGEQKRRGEEKRFAVFFDSHIQNSISCTQVLKNSAKSIDKII
jgi:hypothetical protein